MGRREEEIEGGVVIDKEQKHHFLLIKVWFGDTLSEQILTAL